MSQQATPIQAETLFQQLLHVVGLLLLGTPLVLERVPLLASVSAGVVSAERITERSECRGRD